jgi:hypothetical protein
MSRRWISVACVTFFLATVFGIGFVFFYNRIQRSQAETPNPSKSLIDKPLPQAALVDIYGTKVDEQLLRRGRVVVVFLTMDCDACVTEGKFLQTLIGRRKDVSFYGVIPFGKPESPEVAEKMFPFRVFYDESNSFVSNMGINRVPVKVFLDAGIIKKGWIGAAATDKAKASFVEWLDSLT